MDASASKVRPSEVDNLFGLYLKIENASYPVLPTTIKQKKTVIKYTKLPDDTNSKVPWLPQGHTTEPRFRRIITIEEPKMTTGCSLKSDVAIPSTVMATDICKRKIVTIEEDDEYYYPKYSHQIKKSYSKMINRAVETKEEKPNPQQKISRLTCSSNSTKDMKSYIKSNIANITKELSNTKSENRYKFPRGDNESQDYAKNKSIYGTSRSAKNISSPSRYSLNKKKSSKDTEKEVPVAKNKLKEERLTKLPYKKITVDKTNVEKTRSNMSPNELNQNNISLLKDIKVKHKPIPVIHVPLDQKLPKCDVSTEVSEDVFQLTDSMSHKVDSCVQITKTKFKDISIGTETMLDKVEQRTGVMLNKAEKETQVLIHKVDQGTGVDQDFIAHEYGVNDIKKTFDSLDIPNVSLINNSKSDLPKEDIVDIINKESHILDIPINVVSQKDVTDFRESQLHNSSYIISRATLTYTTKQKINFHVVGNNDILQAHTPASPLKYPMNVVSIYKKEMKNQAYQGDSSQIVEEREEKNDKLHEELDHSNGSTSVNCSYVNDNDKLVKPSDIISTIKVNNGLLHSDYILCEQFQRELNFIDSFFESLQYLESCSLSEKCIVEKEVESWINSSGNQLKHLEFRSFLSKFENEINIDDSKTMASKSLCLLNLLIRDEQRRAKNLLFVLKMREDALKDFTKSQILWLENKKKQDNTDISQLKKKQRGALLKLQHECGEMQRMRKALLTLSEKRKLALMKTKKNIEIKLRNSADVEQIILGKKKLKRSPSSDRNVAPLKCFELSSSGCDDSTTSRPRSTTSVLLPIIPKSISSAEKCVQTSEGAVGTVSVDCSTDTADENFIVVDGGYLNILFHKLSPQIFSSEKQYEVNKEALNNIVHTSNMHQFNWNNDFAIESFMDQIKNHDLEGTNTPSTARSLVEEFDQIYKGLAEDKSHEDSADHVLLNAVIDEINGAANQIAVLQTEDNENVQKPFSQESSEVIGNKTSNNFSMDESCTCVPQMVDTESQSSKNKDVVSAIVAGPLPVPAGAAAVADDVAVDLPTWLTQKASTSSSLVDSSTSSSQQLVDTSLSSLTSPVLFEAEELRRQQLAIEREIKALEQQQCQLLAVREIPDKPPPPYTPPSEPKAPKPPGKFTVDCTIEEKVRAFFPDSKNDEGDISDPFDVFVKDFCQDSIERHKLEKNQKYWDTCDFPPTKPELNTEKLIAKTTSELKEVLTGVAPTVVSGVCNFNGKHGCLKCVTIGEYSHNSHTVTFSDIDCAERTNEGFRNQLYGPHHKTNSPLLGLPIDMVKNFPVGDSLHLLDLGVMKRLLVGWRDGNFGKYITKWRASDIETVSIFLTRCNLPSEIHRAVRALDTLAYWKASEFRSFFYYLSVIILPEVLKSTAYSHFLTLYCGIVICSSEAYQNMLPLADKLLKYFVRHYRDFYGADYVTSNVHNLIHVTAEVMMYGPLQSFNAYPFENQLYMIKKMLRVGQNPLSQVAKRLAEMTLIDVNKNITQNNSKYPFVKTSKNGRKILHMKEYKLSSKTCDRYILTTNNDIIEIKFIIDESDVLIHGIKIQNKVDIFTYPVKSSRFGIYKATSSDECANAVVISDLQEIKCKLVCIKHKEFHYFIPLLHTL